MESFPLERFRQQVADLAASGIYVGTSSWKYEGWLGLIYSPEKYMRYFKEGPPRIVKSRFEKTCLAEYAQTFKTVCLDAGFYQFPSPQMLEGYFSQVPSDFRFSIKVTEDITVMRFPNLPRYGRRAGENNPHFLDADLFISAFLGPLMPYRERVGAIIFEFSTFRATDWETGRQFVAYLDAFLEKLPKGWDYSIEVRNESFLHPRYFEVLKNNGVAHTFNNWSQMPPVEHQIDIIGSQTTDFVAARFLLKPGRTYEQAVKAFQPYSEIKEPNAEARRGLSKLLSRAAFSKTRRRYIYVNNRLEGSAPWTISEVLSAAQVL